MIDIERLVRVNLLGTAAAIGAVLPAMVERKSGHLVGISSLAAYRALPGSSGYCATKSGLSALLEGLRLDLRHSGVYVTTVHPGFVRTPMIEGGSTAQPFLMGVDPACRIILKGILRRKAHVDFPWPMVWLLRSLSILPNWAYDPLVNRAVVRRSR